MAAETLLGSQGESGEERQGSRALSYRARDVFSEDGAGTCVLKAPVLFGDRPGATTRTGLCMLGIHQHKAVCHQVETWQRSVSGLALPGVSPLLPPGLLL